MTEWVQKHPIATQLINIAITAILIFIVAMVAKFYYGDLVIETNENTKFIMDIVIRL